MFLMCSQFLAMLRTIHQVAGVPKAYPADEKSKMFEVNGVVHKAIEMSWKVGLCKIELNVAAL
jgi:hypothetical protein